MQSTQMELSRILLEAIALKQCVQATYNRTVVKLAPHILYTRHGELYVDAVTVERDGKPPKETKLGTFKLAGLQMPSIVNRPFAANLAFNPGEEKYSGVTLFAIETK